MEAFDKILQDLKTNYQLNRVDIQEVMSYVFKCPKESLCLLEQEKLSEKLASVESILGKHKTGIPLEYLLSYKDFCSLRLVVNSNVLIPRPETEILVDKIAQKLRGKHLKTICDVCCGSGAIGLSLKSIFKESELHLSDISTEALNVARQNAKLNNLDVQLHQGDLLEPLSFIKADLFVCNPPYIAPDAYESLDASVKEFEPKLALYAKNQGLEFYERLSIDLPKILNPGAFVAFEIGFDQKESIEKLFSKKPYHNLRFEKDFAGHFRFFFLEFE